MSLSDFQFREEWEHERYADAAANLRDPVLYGYAVVEGDPDYAPYSDDQFAYFTDYLAYLNELPAHLYSLDENIITRSRIGVWMSRYAQFVFES